MKSLVRIISVVLLMAVLVPVHASIVVPGAPPAGTAATTEDPRARPLMERLEAIRGMDRSSLSREEKKDLRKEVRDIKKEAKKLKGGVYLSVGAIIIIILVLILIL